MMDEARRMAILKKHADQAQAEIDQEEAALQRRDLTKRIGKTQAHIVTPEKRRAEFDAEGEWIRCMNTEGSTLEPITLGGEAADWFALELPNGWYLWEIRTLPPSLYSRLVKAGAKLTTNPGMMADREDWQGRPQRAIKDWREKMRVTREIAKQRAVKAEVQKREALAEAQETADKRTKLEKKILKELGF